MKEYIVTFGSGQKHENHFIRVFSNKYSSVMEFMKKIYDDKYCMIYLVEDWNRWEELSKESNLSIESELYSIDLDKEELFVLLDTSRNMYWKKNNYGYSRILSNARRFTFTTAMKRVDTPFVDDLDIILYDEAKELLPGYELEL